MHIHYRTFEKCGKVGNKKKEKSSTPRDNYCELSCLFSSLFLYVYTHIYTSSFNI